MLVSQVPRMSPPTAATSASAARPDVTPAHARAAPMDAPRGADALTRPLALAVAARAFERRWLHGGLLQRVMLTDGTVAGVPARAVTMVGPEIAIGDNLHNQQLSLYTSGASGCASLVTRHGNQLRLAHCPASHFDFLQPAEDLVHGWFANAPTEVILVFGTDYADANTIGRAAHLVEALLAREGAYAGPVSRHYGADRFLVEPNGNVTLNPPHHVAVAQPLPAKKGCCVLM